VSKICTTCGAQIPADAPDKGCAACVLETGLEFFVERNGDRDESTATSQSHRKAAPLCMDMPTEIGDYELLEEIGRGGQGVVYRARQKSLNRTVALKVIGLGHWTTRAALKRFRLEAEAAAGLDHPFIVPIHEVGQHNGCCYFSMKLVEGGQLSEVVKHKPMPLRRSVELVAKLARTVHYAHERGVLHRDIKPGNVLLDANSEPYLTDFGLARLVETESTVTRTMEALGTPSYMAPEQAKGNTTRLTRATDVYGLGAVFYHLLTGHPPFAAGTTFETVRLVLETEPRQPRLWDARIDRDAAIICLKCLEKDPQRRYASALALAEDLERWLRHEPIQARRTGLFTRGSKWARRNPTLSAMVASFAVLTAVVGLMAWRNGINHHTRTTGIAVLPFENLGNDREDASFADGLQDDIVTKLAKIARLKVISRASVMQYRGNGNVREISQALRVSHVLQGSIRKTGAWLHINAQLIDARTNTHVWAEEYDRDLKDVFAIQAEIARKVAERLHVKISNAEKLAIERPPTADLTAFDLYSRARNLVLEWSYRMSAKDNLPRAADLLNQALVRDPTFIQGYCQLAWIHDQLYALGFDRTPGRLELADAAIQAAFRIRPDAGEAHLARAGHLYRGYRDFDGALAELETAGKALPNDARLFELKGYIERRRPGGNQEEVLRDFERAIDLDPRNFLILQQTSLSYDNLRRYREEKLIFDRMLAIKPDDVETKVNRAFVELDWKADTRPLHQITDSIRVTNPSMMASVAGSRLLCALAERDPAAAEDALIARGDTPLNDDVVKFNRPFLQGLIARMMNNNELARASFRAARAEQEKTVQAQPNYAPALCVLGLIDAALGRKEEALREGKRAVDLLPVEKDALSGIAMIRYLAMIAAWAGDKDLACEQLATASNRPGWVSYGQLKLMPFWDPLRGDPRFEKIVASLAPK
jgi:serine/threonine protein kinase/tetratricopeptide (TPR) repeat protein